jgi:tetratricopeptide (TPR) repeat protein
MPAHIYARTGNFAASADSNAKAAAVDEKYMKATGTRTGMYPLMYYNHNLHFESYAAAMAGQYSRASRLATKLARNVGPSIAEMPMLEGFMPQQYYVLLRFAKWDEVLALAEPAPAMQLTAAVRHFARAAAFAARKDLPRARASRQAYLEAVAKVPPDMPVGVLNTAKQMFAVATPLLEGRIAVAEGRLSAAVEQYAKAVEAEDTLTYDEPPTWFYPVRETLGAALVADGKAAAAERVFLDDLKLNPGNGRSLFGLWKAIEAQGRTADAARAAARFRRAWAAADSRLTLGGM